MIPPSFLILLAWLLQPSGSEAQSSHVSKFHPPGGKEQNGDRHFGQYRPLLLTDIDVTTALRLALRMSRDLNQKTGVQESHQEKVIAVSGEGTIHSPDFPHIYPRNIVMVWRLVAASNMRIQLFFDERFGLEDPEDGICKYDFVELEDPSDGSILGRWCGSQAAPAAHLSKGNRVRVRFVSDEYFPSEPGFLIRYAIQPAIPAEAESPDLQELSAAVSGLRTVEEVMKYLEPERWRLDIDDLYKPTWHVLGKSFIHNKKVRGGADLNLLWEEAQLYSCTPRNLSVSLREELKRTDAIFWPSCLLVRRCGGNCACCANRCYDCQCQPARVTKKYHEVLLLKHRSGGRGLQKSMTDVALEHHEECTCVCKDADNANNSTPVGHD
ncbi:platelet-derived growth factor C-like isoform X1 [Syngnathus typhle]|uniref:platelet-derived growth factor C-like isoform X1 n=1 Tax=Syngnathus typhle TaxID=161592 RepID=UPI002A69D95F|nr:platelet-derived growth factor C-like isoform X1 [Syngnathus typhle]